MPPHPSPDADLWERSFDRVDEGDDSLFYSPARLVRHIDDSAVATLSALYAGLLEPGAAVLDLMSSWVSHLPPAPQLAEVVGHGMNAEELAANPRLTRWWVQDLNSDPRLPLDNDSFDAALCCVGVQYLRRPFDVFAEVRRVLRSGAYFAVSFSNRCFPTKAVAVWRALDAPGQANLVRLYMERSGFSAVEARVLADGASSDPLVPVTGRA